MFKNKIFFIICVGTAIQPLYSTESQGKSKSNSSSWANSPLIWGSVALAGTVGAWVYKKYQEYNIAKRQAALLESRKNFVSSKMNFEKNNPQKYSFNPREATLNKQNSPLNSLVPIKRREDKKTIYDFVFDTYEFYLQNRLPDKNFFEKTAEELKQPVKKSVLNGVSTDFYQKWKLMEETGQKDFYKNKFKKLKKLLKEKNLFFDIQRVMKQNNNDKKELLQTIAKNFIEVQQESLELASNDPYLKYFFPRLLSYYKPIQTLKNMTEGKNDKK